MINTKKLFLGFVCILFCCSNQNTSKGILEISEIPPLKVYSCDSDSIIISSEAKSALISNNLKGCEWPKGHPDESDFHFCNEERFEDKPYCLKHCAVAYVIPEKEEVERKQTAQIF